MTEEIKGRIEQIKAGQVPEGYIKQYKYIFPVSWKLYHLGELTQNNSRKNMTADELPTYSINNQVGFIPQNEQFDEGSYSDLDKTCYKIVKRGEFAYNPARINVGSLGLLKDKDAVIVSSLYVCFSLKREFSNLYFENWFTTTAFHKEILRNLEGSVREYLFYENFSNIRLPVPPLPEQKKIAEILRQCDKVIELKQSKIEELQKLKKTCLSKMFPKKGHNVPELRFPGFTDAWEQRKLSELTSMHARIGWQNLRTSEFLDSGNYMLITGTDFNDGAINFSTCHYVERERYEQDRNIQIHNGSILITKDGTLGKVAYVQGLSMPATLNAGVFNVQIKDANNVDEKYLFQYLKAPFLMDYVDKKATGGTIKHLNQSILVDFPVILPQRSEQTLIGAFFQQLDNLITLHQRELEETRKYKKALMQLLLTGIVRVQR